MDWTGHAAHMHKFLDGEPDHGLMHAFTHGAIIKLPGPAFFLPRARAVGCLVQSVSAGPQIKPY